MLKAALVAAILSTSATSALAVDAVYKIDPMHTYPSLEFPHMGYSIWRGKFNKTSGTLTLDLAAKKGSVDITIDTDSIDFGLDSMHEEAVNEKWLNAAKYPQATYKGKLVFTGDKPTSVDGQLTIKDITRPLTLKINSYNCSMHVYYKKDWCGADAEGSLHWADFGMKNYGEGDADKLTFRVQMEAGKD